MPLELITMKNLNVQFSTQNSRLYSMSEKRPNFGVVVIKNG